jgi:hypothetical protein
MSAKPSIRDSDKTRKIGRKLGRADKKKLVRSIATASIELQDA